MPVACLLFANFVLLAVICIRNTAHFDLQLLAVQHLLTLPCLLWFVFRRVRENNEKANKLPSIKLNPQWIMALYAIIAISIQLVGGGSRTSTADESAYRFQAK